MDMLLFFRTIGRTSCRTLCSTVRRCSAASLIALLLVGWSTAANAFWSLGMIPGIYIPQTYYKHGAVYTRAIVLSPAGNPYYVEYDSSGNEGREIAEKTGEYERAQIMAGAYYRSLLQRLADTKERYPEHEEMTAAAYRGSTFKTAGGETIQKPSIASTSLTVLVRAQNERYLKDGSDLLLLELPIKASVQPSASSQSLLLSEAGDILHQTANTIAFRVGFYGKDGKVETNKRRDHDSEIYGKMPNVVVTMGGFTPGGIAATDENGKYRMNYFLPPCPGFTFEYTTPVYLELYYSRFNPRGNSMMPYYLVRQDYDFCNGLSVYSMGAAMVIATMATPMKPKFDFPVDLMVVDGAAAFANVKLDAKTAYNPETSDYAKTVQDAYDFDGDEKPEIIVPGKKVKKTIDGKEREVFVETAVAEAELQGIYLSSRHSAKPASTEDTAPDFTRLIDTTADFKDRGMLQSISKDDLRDTDIYVFRESTGQLVAERRGLHENELYKTFSGVDDKQGSFRFTIQLRGSAENRYAMLGRNGEANFNKWQSAGGFTEEFQKRTANHLKSGEQVRIIAINRPTGYMGSTRINLNASLNGNMIDLNQARIQLTPPNLKIWAERKNKIEQGMTRGEEKKQLIGNEGAGLGSDISIAIYSDWRDQDGGPLPEALADYGYTGRLAKIVSANQLAPVGANNLSQFKIKPGQQVQVIQLPEKVLAKQHLYLQVAGQPENRNPDFATGNGEGILKYRPSKYVPVQVPLHDEEASEIARQAYRKADKEKPELNLKKPEPMYSWQYRPEMQFSLYELNVNAIRTVDAQGNSEDILGAAKPQIDGANDYVSFLYNLIKSSFGTLDAWSYQGERELVLAFGEEEIKATIGASQEIRFENIEHLGGLSPDDYLSLRLYANNDTANTLWEFAFGSDLLGQAPTDYISVDSRSVDLVSYLPLEPDEQDLKNVKVHWSVTGGGQLASSITDSKYGIFHNTLTATTVAGTKHTVTAKVVESQDDRVPVGSELKIGPMTVVAGVAKTIELSSESSELLSSGVDKTKITGKVYDQFNNPVQEGTPVSWQTGYSGQLEEVITAADEHGQVTAEYRAGLETLSTDITLSTGNVNSKTTISKKALDYSISLSSTNFTPGTSGTVTVTLNQAPQEAIDVIWNNSTGLIFGPDAFEGTTAQAQFRVDDETSSNGHVSVNIGGVIKDLDYSITPADPEGSIRFDYAAIAAGAQSVYEVETLRGSELQTVVQSTNATVYGKPNTKVTLSAGGFFTPNQEPVALFPMAGFDLDDQGKQVAIDTIGGLQAKVDGDVVWDQSDSYLGAGGSSLKFEGGRLLVTDDDTLDYNTDYFANIRFKATTVEAGTVLLRKGSNDSNGYELSIVDDDGVSRLQARVSTDQGDFTVVSSVPIEADRWYLAGLQLRNGVLMLGLDAGRFTAAAPGVPNNSGFANNLIIGAGFRGNINEIKLGQIHGSRGSLVLIDGVAEKEITFDQDGKARVSISGGTAKLNTLGSRVGFTITSDSAIAQTESKELRYRTAISRMTLLGNPVEQSYAQGASKANTYEGGVAVVDGQAMAEAIEMLKKAGKPALDALQTATQFLFEMTSISDVWQLTKATYLWANGRFDEVDKIELAFAGIGVTLTVVTIAVSVGTVGAGAPGSIAAMISVKAALTVLKKTLKEVFINDPGQILRIGGTAARWSFDLVAKILSGKQGATDAIKQLVDFKDVFIELITSGTTAAWSLLKSIGHSADGFIAFLNLRKLRTLPCSASVDKSIEYLYVRMTPLSLGVNNAYAAPLCGVGLDQKLIEIMLSKGLTSSQKKTLTDIVVKATRAGGSKVGGLVFSERTVELLADFSSKGRGESILKFLSNMEDQGLKAMGGFRFDKMSKVLANGDTPFDMLMDAMNDIPSTHRVQAFNQLATSNISNIRGIYGEAAMFKRMKSNPNLTRENPSDGFVRVNNPDALKVGSPVPMNGVMKQGIDAEGAFFEGVSSTGGPLFVEVKNYTSLYRLDNLRAQVGKHFDTKIMDALNGSRNGWENGKPHLHFEWMGDGFSKEVSLANRKKAVLDICGDYVKGALARAVPAFDCKKDITFHIVDELIDPLTSKGS